MSFWDRFVWAVYFGMAQRVQVGRATAVRIVELALTRQTFLSALSDASLLQLMALLPATSPHRAAVVSVAQSRQLLDPVQLLATALVASPRRLTEVVETYRAGDQVTRNAARDALLQPGHLMLYENLHLFLARRFLIDPANSELHNLVVRSITNATRRYVRIPIGTVDYLCFLYQVVFQRTGLMAILPAMSPPSLNPLWYLSLSTVERRFIQVSMSWAEEIQELFYLHCCALLTVEQIACAMDSPGMGNVDDFVLGLEQCWAAIL